MLTEQQEMVYNWINSVDNAEFLKFKEEYKLGVRCGVWAFGLGTGWWLVCAIGLGRPQPSRVRVTDFRSSTPPLIQFNSIPLYLGPEPR